MLSESKKIIVITGPTAVGKTSISLEIAKQLDTHIISADSRQIYKEMSIGTAKPDQQTLDTIPHHLVDCTSIHEAFSTGDFMRQGRKIIDKLFQTKNYIVVSGGTGLYIKALLHGINEFPEVEPEILEEIEADLKNKGLEFLQNELLQKDPNHYSSIDIHNARRITRALSIIRQSGRTYTSFTSQKPTEIAYDHLYFVLDRPREILYERINRRVDQMMKDGLLAEAKTLYPYKNLRALQTVGYKELFDFFEAKMTENEAISKIKQHTRNYAKRQLTWFRSVDNAKHIEVQSDIVQNILNEIK